MKQIVFIENRTNREEYFLEQHPEVAEQFRQLQGFTNITGTPCEEALKQIDENNLDFLKPFDLIVIHRSALITLPGGSGLNRLISFCQQFRKALILFSGNIGSSFYSELPHPFLLINSKDLYSSNLIPFLQSYTTSRKTNLISLRHGKNWRLSFLLLLQEILLMNDTKIKQNKRLELCDLLFDGKAVSLSEVEVEINELL